MVALLPLLGELFRPALGCLGMTKARVCFKRERSCIRAEISGRSRFLLFSRRVLMSMEGPKSISGYCFLI